MADGEPHLDFARCAARLQHVRRAGEEYADIDGSFFSRRLLGKAEEIGDQIAGAAGLVDDFAEQRVLLVTQALLGPEFL